MATTKTRRLTPAGKVLSWSPRIFLFQNFLSEKECDYIISESTPHLTRSEVSYGQEDTNNISSIRTSFGTALKTETRPILKNIEERISLLTFFPVSHGESFAVIRYEVGQEFR